MIYCSGKIINTQKILYKKYSKGEIKIIVLWYIDINYRILYRTINKIYFFEFGIWKK